MRILITCDVPEWAIGNLTQDIITHNERFTFINIPAHPRKVDEAYLAIKNALDEGIDFWHAQYWRSAIQLLEQHSRLRDIPSLLTHHNHNALKEANWDNFDALNEMTAWGCDVLNEVHDRVFKIPHGIDLDRYEYNNDYPPEGRDKKTVGYVGRVVPWKNLHLINKAAVELGYRVLAPGYIDKQSYWEGIADKENIDFKGSYGRQGMAPANVKDDCYKHMDVFVMYSTGERESGTLPLLEAMAMGVPVLATAQGMARDLIIDGKNGIIFDHDNFKEKLQMLMEDVELRKKIRKEAWNTIKNYPVQKMAWMYGKAYYKTLYPGKKLVSVIIPTFNRYETLLKVIKSIDSQDYPAKEIIIADDGSTDHTYMVATEAKKSLKTPILYLKCGNKYEYGLARARNKGATEAMGEVLFFLDDRYTLHEGALSKAMETVSTKTWKYGRKVIKGVPSTKKAFIENFSWLYKKDFFEAGAMSERLTMYGGMSQELRTRFIAQGFDLSQDEMVLCDEIVSSRALSKKRNEIWRAKHLLYKMYEHSNIR